MNRTRIGGARRPEGHEVAAATTDAQRVVHLLRTVGPVSQEGAEAGSPFFRALDAEGVDPAEALRVLLAPRDHLPDAEARFVRDTVVGPPRLTEPDGLEGWWVVAYGDFAPLWELVRHRGLERGEVVVARARLPWSLARVFERCDAVLELAREAHRGAPLGDVYGMLRRAPLPGSSKRWILTSLTDLYPPEAVAHVASRLPLAPMSSPG